MPTATGVNKIPITWPGPAKVEKLVSLLVARTEDLPAGKLQEIHVSRMKFYDNALLNVNKDLTDHLTDQHASLYPVDDCKAVSKTRSFSEVTVPWAVFSNVDA